MKDKINIYKQKYLGGENDKFEGYVDSDDTTSEEDINEE